MLTRRKRNISTIFRIIPQEVPIMNWDYPTTLVIILLLDFVTTG